MSSAIDLTGQIFTRLTVLKKSRRKGIGIFWKCKCICGKEVIVLSSSLRSGKTRSCGCYNIAALKARRGTYKLSPGEVGLRRLYRAYQQGAKRRNRSFELSLEQVKGLTSASCIYCGSPPKLNSFDRGKRTDTVDHTRRQHGNYVYNGIDRVDNTKGYTVENCRTCCSLCNFAKRDRTEKEFLAWIQQLVKHQSSAQS